MEQSFKYQINSKHKGLYLDQLKENIDLIYKQLYGEKSS